MCTASSLVSVPSMVMYVVYFRGHHFLFCAFFEAFRTKTKAWAVRPRFKQRHFTPTERQI
jgi:hypothetical protein